ncbi:imelysin family protein [Viscerimonas tarda]
MKRFFKLPAFALLATAMAFVATSCSDSDSDIFDTEKETALSQAIPQYVNNTVIATYKSLADETIDLHEALVALRADKTDENVQIAANEWIKARDYWELSEAFLYGAASDFGIDPHIDTWPLAKDELLALLKNDSQINGMDSEEGDAYVGEFLGKGLLGFHGIEYILFEAGGTKAASRITDKELVYAIAVSGDLRNQCFRLEASWAGLDKVSAEKREKLEELGLQVTITGGRSSYGDNMLNAGKAGSGYVSVVDAGQAIIEGCITIADEVATTKIGQPHTGEDVNYIESPYSFNSKVDFIGNIKSIENTYLGGADAARRGASISDYIKKINPTLDTRVKNAITEAIAKIDAIPYPFAQNFTSPKAGEAMDACNELAEILQEVKIALNN